MLRYIEGRSGGQAAAELGGISRSHVNLLANMALDIQSGIHRKAELKNVVRNYVLQIDGTVDDAFRSLIAVRDAVTGIVLNAMLCGSENLDEIIVLLNSIETVCGSPSGIISDLSSTLGKALAAFFPGVPRAVCKFHFLRDIGRDMMSTRNSAIAKMLRRIGAKSKLKAIVRTIGGALDGKRVVEELKSGYSSDSEQFTLFMAKYCMEKLINAKESSGYGFPFASGHAHFVSDCAVAQSVLEKLVNIRANESVVKAIAQLKRVTGNAELNKLCG